MTDEAPEETRLGENLLALAREGCAGVKVRWLPGASALTREERAAEVNRWLEADARGEFEVIDFLDSNR